MYVCVYMCVFPHNRRLIMLIKIEVNPKSLCLEILTYFINLPIFLYFQIINLIYLTLELREFVDHISWNISSIYTYLYLV